MRTRYFSFLALGIAGAFTVVATAVFSPSVMDSLAFAISIGTLVVGLGITALYRTHIPSVVAGLLTAGISAWTVVASLVFSDSTVQTLALGSSLAISGLAIAGMTAHELSSERVVHSLQVEASDREQQPATA
jgi:hypothetical protein